MHLARDARNGSKSTISAILAGLGVLAFAACGSAQKVEAPLPSPSTKADVSALESDAAAPHTQDDVRTDAFVARPTLPACGCSLCAPVVSNDACTVDADCAPSDPCHAEACVARAKAKPATPQTQCTMDLRCNSVDVNTCGCLQGHCALFPKKQPAAK
jgi:hypothetical protein